MALKKEVKQKIKADIAKKMSSPTVKVGQGQSRLSGKKYKN